jgi:hypothetical protein
LNCLVGDIFEFFDVLVDFFFFEGNLLHFLLYLFDKTA